MGSFIRILFAAAVITGVSAFTCPKCTNENNWRSCTDSQTCTGNVDICQLIVENDGTRHKLDYHCAHSQNCHDEHETQHCDINLNGHCQFCCDSIASCKTQREGIFDTCELEFCP
uniref:TNFR-Cys domain-containing protein n=1 Tax=Biomphalaria glabrata TaxID=6526 RepID=A0A2C9LEG4_BIOGL